MKYAAALTTRKTTQTQLDTAVDMLRQSFTTQPDRLLIVLVEGSGLELYKTWTPLPYYSHPSRLWEEFGAASTLAEFAVWLSYTQELEPEEYDELMTSELLVAPPGCDAPVPTDRKPAWKGMLSSQRTVTGKAGLEAFGNMRNYHTRTVFPTTFEQLTTALTPAVYDGHLDQPAPPAWQQMVKAAQK